MFPNGVDLGLFKPGDRSKARSELGIIGDRFVIAFVGHFEEQKGLTCLLDAVQGLEQVALLLVGQGSIKVKDGGSVAFKGRLPHARIPLALAAADIFVLPTRVEGSCNAVIEAIACGLPIVTSDGRYMDDIVDDGVAVRTDPMDVRAIREAIVVLMLSLIHI